MDEVVKVVVEVEVGVGIPRHEQAVEICWLWKDATQLGRLGVGCPAVVKVLPVVVVFEVEVVGEAFRLALADEAVLHVVTTVNLESG